MDIVKDMLWRHLLTAIEILLGFLFIVGFVHLFLGFLNDKGVEKAVASIIRRIDLFFRGPPK